MKPTRPLPRITAQAFAEDALAIANWAESYGFADDAARMRKWANGVMAELPASARWQERAS